MIVGLGMDLVEVARVGAARVRFGQRFLDRIYSPAEIDWCFGQSTPDRCLAARFAAKEAISKALGVGIGTRIGWRDLEIQRGPAGEPRPVLLGPAALLAADRGVRNVWLTLTHTAGHAAAVAVLDG